LVIAALGYRPIAMPIADRGGVRIPLAALDHDNICRPDRLARQVAYLDAASRHRVAGHRR
jgi:hypothetical protein